MKIVSMKELIKFGDCLLPFN